MISCGAYCRYSHDDNDDSESVKLQVERSHQVAREHGWTLDKARLFTDDGYSGREMVKRPGFRACLEAVSRRDFPILIVRDLDRFARGEVFHVGHALQTLADHDVRLFEYMKGDFLRIDGEHALMTTFRAYSNRSEALKASERIKDKLLARDEKNDGWTSAAPYGFKNQRKRLSDGEIGVFLDRKGTIGVLVPHPDEFPVLLLVGELFIKIGTYNGVAMELNKRKIPGPDGGIWQSRTVSKIVSNPAYRGKVVRGRKMSVDKGGTLTVVSAPADRVRVYDRPELRVWPVEMLAEIDALIQVRSRTTTWSPRERKHLSSSFVRCSYCGSSVSAIKGGKQKYGSYCCTRSRVGACRELGYRAEHKVDAGVIMAAGMLLTDDVLAKTKQIIRETLDVKRQIDARDLDLDRLDREVRQTEKRVRAAEQMALDSEGAERDRHRTTLREQLARLADLREAQARAQATPAPADAKTVLERLEARVDELRAGLAQGGLDALPAVSNLLGEDRLDATRRGDGKWDLNGEGYPIRVFHGDSEFVKVGPKQKKAAKKALATPATPAEPTAPVTPATAPVNPAAPKA
jgi:site-specific DNA recombinase